MLKVFCKEIDGDRMDLAELGITLSGVSSIIVIFSFLC